MSFIHYIIISSSYSTGKRIAIHRCFENDIDEQHISSIIKRIIMSCPDGAPFSTQIISTESSTWESVVEADIFFKGIEVILNVDDFIQLIKEDCFITAIDVAKYISSKKRCSHLKLQKLVYFCYADYLAKHEKKLFADTIYAFRNGPVVKSLYEQLKGNGCDIIEIDKLDSTKYDKSFVKQTPKFLLPTRSKILFSENGVDKIVSIDETVAKYGNLEALALVSLTHKLGSPWSRSCQTGQYDEIEDKEILNFHSVEEIAVE